jgi:drug/metabolite transporter (DMT)-like permease
LLSSATARWLFLAALWSLQHIFGRIAVPVLGAALVAELRALFALAFLVPWVVFAMRDAIRLREHWRDQLAVCMVNNALPFICFAYAATALPASYLAVMNGMVPLWSALISVPVLKEPLDARRIAGFVLGIAGVALIVKLGPIELTPRTAVAAVAGMVGAAFWGWAGVVIRQRSERVAPISLAVGSVILATVVLSPAWLQAPPLAAWTPGATAAAVALGILVSGVAYLPFFTLVRDIGPTRTLTVGLAVPVLGLFWGWLLLGETITLSMIAGAGLVLVALLLVMKR